MTLNEASYVIFVDEPWSKALKEQAEDRAHRIGTKENITIITLLCKNTIDEKINKIVKEKGEMAGMLVDGKLTNTDKAELVNYLLE